MTIVEAMKASKESGESYSRMPGGDWIRYVEGFTYKLTADDILADDWITSREMVETITAGKWTTAD